MDNRIRNPILLDRSKLLGFDQFSRLDASTGLDGIDCAKVGNKPATAPCLPAPNFAKVGVKPNSP